MYGSIDKKQMTCRISWVILFCFCDITFLLSQEQGKFVSKKLENIAFQLSSQYQADCSVKQRILLKPLCPDKQIIVTTDLYRTVNHIGFELFDRTVMEQNPSPVYTFVERYLLELLLTDNDEGMRHLLEESKVMVRLGQNNRLLTHARLLSVLREMNSAHSFIITTDNSRYTMVWYHDKEMFFSLRFHIQYELIWGMNKVEAENLFYMNLENYRLGRRPSPACIPQSLKALNDSCYVTGEDFYGIEAISSSQYYKKETDGKFTPILDIHSPVESISNLFTISADERCKVQVTQCMYGNRKNSFELPLCELVDYCKNSGCDVYVGMERSVGNHFWGIAFMVNRSLGYNHLLYFDTDIRILLYPDRYKMNMQLYGFVPIHNLRNLFGGQN